MAAQPDATVPAWALIAGSAITGGLAALQYWLGKRSDGHAAELETQRKAEAEAFRQEERLRDRVDRMQLRRDEDAATVQTLRGELATLAGRVVEVLGENERLKRQAEEQAQEAANTLRISDLRYADYREQAEQEKTELLATLEATREQLRQAQGVIAELRERLDRGANL